jgi:hypothetical protein
MLQEKLKLTESFQSFPEGDSDGDDSLLEDDVLCDQVTFLCYILTGFYQCFVLGSGYTILSKGGGVVWIKIHALL